RHRLGYGLCSHAAAWAEILRRCAAFRCCGFDGATDCRSTYLAERWHDHENDRSGMAKFTPLPGKPAVLCVWMRINADAPADAEGRVRDPAGGCGAQSSDLLRRYDQHNRQYWSSVLIRKTPLRRGFLWVTDYLTTITGIWVWRITLDAFDPSRCVVMD